MQSFLYGTGITTLYILVAVVIVLLLRKLIKIPDELFRKILHFILLGAYILLVSAFVYCCCNRFFSCIGTICQQSKQSHNRTYNRRCSYNIRRFHDNPELLGSIKLADSQCSICFFCR